MLDRQALGLTRGPLYRRRNMGTLKFECPHHYRGSLKMWIDWSVFRDRFP
jgi:hypothetical protein